MNIYKPNLFNIKKLNINKSFYRCNTNNLNSFQNSPINFNQKSFIDLKRTKISKNKKKINLSQEIKFNKKLKLNNSFFYSDINSYSYRYKKNYYNNNNNNSIENIEKKIIKNKFKLNYNLGERKYKKIKNNFHKNKNNSVENIFHNNNNNNNKNLLKNTSFLNITENNYNIHVNNYISKNNNNNNHNSSNKKHKNKNNFNILELKKFNLFNFLNSNISTSSNNSSQNKEIKYNLNDIKIDNNNFNNVNNINNRLNETPEEIHFFFVKIYQKNKNILKKIN